MISQGPNMSIKSILIAIILTAAFATHSLGQSSIPTEPTFFYQVCDSKYGNYTTNSSYVADLKTVLTTLQKQSSVSPFSNSSAGSVYGQYYCRFDIDSALCSACVSQASALTASCPNFKSSIIWYDICSLRYRNESMYGVRDTRWYSYQSSLSNVSDPSSFYVTLNSTLTKLSSQAAYGDDFRKYAIADVKVSTFETTYFLVQCSPDLSPADCETCLLVIDSYVDTCCGNWPVSAIVNFASCQMRYSNLLFYTAPPSTSLPPPPPSAFPPPPPPPVKTSPSDDSIVTEVPTVSNVSQDLTEWQAKHANLVITTVKEISKLRYELCPRSMKDRQFWRIYFVLVNSHIAPFPALKTAT